MTPQRRTTPADSGGRRRDQVGTDQSQDTTGPRQAQNSVYGASSIKRHRRTNAELAAVDDAIIAAIDQDAPVTLRGVYYRVLSMGVIPKTENAYKMIGRRLVDLRRSGRVSYRDITDGTRMVFRPRTYDDPESALAATARLYRRSLWNRSRYRVSIFTEKDAISGAIWEVTDSWDVPLGVMRGYASETFVWTFADSLSMDHHNVVAQLGDHDPSGVGAWENFCEKTMIFAEAGCSVEFVRLAVTPDQILEMDLPTRPTKTSDTRSKNWTGGESVEVDAIPANELRRIVDEFITGHVDMAEYLQLMEVEKAERQSMMDFAAAWSGGGQ